LLEVETEVVVDGPIVTTPKSCGVTLESVMVCEAQFKVIVPPFKKVVLADSAILPAIF
jgi:hypothetical protein